MALVIENRENDCRKTTSRAISSADIPAPIRVNWICGEKLESKMHFLHRERGVVVVDSRWRRDLTGLLLEDNSPHHLRHVLVEVG